MTVGNVHRRINGTDAHAMHNSNGDSVDTETDDKAAKPKERQRVLIDYVLRLGSARIDELASHFGVSRMTVHRDLTALEEQGVVRRVHGGVTVRSSNLVESTFLYRARLADRE